MVLCTSERQDHLLDVAQSVFAEQDLVADEERAALDRALRVVEQPRFDLGALDRLTKTLGVQAGREQGGPQYRHIVAVVITVTRIGCGPISRGRHFLCRLEGAGTLRRG